MGTKNKAIDDTYVATFFEDADGTPKSSFATTWLRTNLGFFRVDLTVVGPKTEEPQSYLALTRSEAQNMLKTISDIVIFLKEQLR